VAEDQTVGGRTPDAFKNFIKEALVNSQMADTQAVLGVRWPVRRRIPDTLNALAYPGIKFHAELIEYGLTFMNQLSVIAPAQKFSSADVSHFLVPTSTKSIVTDISGLSFR